MKILMVRHAMPEGAEKGKRFLGLTDEPLCDEGWQQALIAGQIIAEMLPPGKVRITASTLRRSMQTAWTIGRQIGDVILDIDDDLREIDMGTWDGRYLDEIRKEYPDEFEARGKDLWNYRTPGGETFAEAGERFRDAVSFIVRYALDDETVVIVSHGGVMRAGLSLMTDKSFDDWMKTDIPYACILVLNRTDSSDGDIRLELERIIA